jgi:two-component system NtrC family response regulator
MDLLTAYTWPGNVRELENKLSRAAILCVKQTIEPEDIEISASSLGEFTFKDARDIFEKEFVLRAVRNAGFNISVAAKNAGLSRPTFYDLLKRHNIQITAEKRIAGD